MNRDDIVAIGKQLEEGACDSSPTVAAANMKVFREVVDFALASMDEMSRQLEEAREAYDACHEAHLNCANDLAASRRQGDGDRKRIEELEDLLDIAKKSVSGTALAERDSAFKARDEAMKRVSELEKERDGAIQALTSKKEYEAGYGAGVMSEQGIIDSLRTQLAEALAACKLGLQIVDDLGWVEDDDQGQIPDAVDAFREALSSPTPASEWLARRDEERCAKCKEKKG